MKRYTIKPEYFDAWGATYDTALIDETEITRLAEEWETTTEELLKQVDEVKETVIINGTETTIDIAANLMDDDIREYLHMEGITDPQEFIDRYCALHSEKYGEEFTV